MRAAALIPAMIFAGQHGSVFSFVLFWGLSAAVAAVYGCVQTGLLPRWRGVPGWLRQQSDLGPRYMVENVSMSGAAMLRMYGLGAIAGLADVAAIRGADLLLAPLVAVLMGLCLVAVPEGARVLQRSPHRLWRFCLMLGSGQGAAALAWGLALVLLLPDSAGRMMLGPIWEHASPLVVPAALAVTSVGFANGAAAGLRALGAARRSLRTQLLSGTAYVLCGLAGAAVAGAPGSAWGAALATLFGATVAWTQLRAGLREYETPELPLVHPVNREEDVETQALRDEMRTS